ncbi:non-hydrolyzing UDP-N-acetylglucosamine 2-epimerase [[Limnothrix rosea] IAM M-220]|uniref:non-hydrolyzing UDP-N-acetylglucosamine 2-epimerase n=1 Tax=[Limnothrix rosea] IAM M-220 TaxID=454133 RepID=UPI0009623762|nr:UDP-N-acetylglucosamine 2-epimerase (non-hydrolyzing) [[Limnothrix rosea] IAM M-220]OKH13839.1 UDP-N-acetylglucosamine 2-epimerase [[Limnothrix rosea] IAM M-220]
MKILTIIGARPQFIKAAAVSRIVRSEEHINEVLVHTGQHYDRNMSDVFFGELDIPRPDYNLGIGSASHGVQTGKMLAAIEEVLLKEKPDWMLVYGDTNSTLAGAIAAAKLHIPIAHVEAGLRSFNRNMPEEVNRVLTDHAADLLFTPTTIASKNLLKEGIASPRIHLVGDVMYDAALFYVQQVDARSRILGDLNLKKEEYILSTIHRAENTDSHVRLTAIINALSELGKEIKVVLPLHPRTGKILKELDLFDQVSQSLCLIEPVGYYDMIALEKNAKMIVTDSGGIQKEAYFYQVPCATLRDETEWLELMESGWNCLIPPHCADEMVEKLRVRMSKLPPSGVMPLYGDGTASEKILKILSDSL